MPHVAFLFCHFDSVIISISRHPYSSLIFKGLTVVELKEKLKHHGLAVSGVKSVLISRLQEHEHSIISEKIISHAVPGKGTLTGKNNDVTNKDKTISNNANIIDELETLMNEGELILNKKNYNSAIR